MYKPIIHHATRLTAVLGVASLALAATLSVAQADIIPDHSAASSGASPQWTYTPSLADGNNAHHASRSIDPLVDHTLVSQENEKEKIRGAKLDGKAGRRVSPTAIKFDLPPLIKDDTQVSAPDGGDSFFIGPNGPAQTLLNAFSSDDAVDNSPAESEKFPVKLSNGLTLDVTINSPCEGDGKGQSAAGVCSVIPEGPSLGFLVTGLLPLGFLALRQRFRVRPSA